MAEGPGLADSYARWRTSPLGVITERLEERVVFDLVGPLRGRKVLDVGTGDGTYAIEAARRGAKVTAIDVDPAMPQPLVRARSLRASRSRFARRVPSTCPSTTAASTSSSRSRCCASCPTHEEPCARSRVFSRRAGVSCSASLVASASGRLNGGFAAGSDLRRGGALGSGRGVTSRISRAMPGFTSLKAAARSFTHRAIWRPGSGLRSSLSSPDSARHGPHSSRSLLTSQSIDDVKRSDLPRPQHDDTSRRRTEVTLDRLLTSWD